MVTNDIKNIKTHPNKTEDARLKLYCGTMKKRHSVIRQRTIRNLDLPTVNSK